MPQPYTIARLATAAGVHVETVRYYQRRGLLREPPRPPGGVRRYDDADAGRLRFIKRAQAMGFTLAETANLLSLQSRRSCRATRELAATKLLLVDARLRELRKLRQELAGLIVECDTNAENSVCPVIERLGAKSMNASRGRREARNAAAPSSRLTAQPRLTVLR